MEAQREQAPSMGSCPACGAPLAAEAAACPACGRSTLREEASAETTARMPGPHEWRCDWCEAINPLGAQRCSACGAVYPRADQDAAVQRAADARIRIALDEIVIRERLRPKLAWATIWRRIFG
jgi:rRNA maturation endonuclease Nob1